MTNTVLMLVFYDSKNPTVVCADASSYGIVGVLMQGQSDQLRLEGFCSRTRTHRDWGQISSNWEECLAAVWTCERLSRYLVELPSFQLLTDHKPLIPLINQKDLKKTALRCQRLLMHLIRFNPQAEHASRWWWQILFPEALSVISVCKEGSKKADKRF